MNLRKSVLSMSILETSRQKILPFVISSSVSNDMIVRESGSRPAKL